MSFFVFNSISKNQVSGKLNRFTELNYVENKVAGCYIARISDPFLTANPAVISTIFMI